MVGLDPHRQPVENGTLEDDNLENEIKALEKLFTVDREKLKSITTHFVQELEEGLKRKGSDIPMNLTWVMGFPTGHERGRFLTLDIGGTNLRVCEIMLTEKPGGHEILQTQYRLPEELKKGKAEELWEYAADSLQKFLQDHPMEDGRNGKVPLGFTFSYPTSQDYIDHGILQTWTKGFDIDGVEGHDVAAQLREALAKRELPIELVVVANDTTGALIASAYTDQQTVVGAVFGTGCNAAYMENCGSIPKIRHHNLSPDTPMAINCEYGAFDNARLVLPRNGYDEQIDRESPRPCEQTFEKMSARLYLGEIFRLALLDLAEDKKLIFHKQDTSRLKESYILDTAILSHIENDKTADQSDTRDLFKDKLNINPSNQELKLCRRLAETIAIRGARLSACGVGAICLKKHIKTGHVAADGSVVNKHPNFMRRWAEALGEILDWPEKDQRGDRDPVSLCSAEDGSGVGVAVIAALTIERSERGDMVGIKRGGDSGGG